MTDFPQTGPCTAAYTRDQLLELWTTVVDGGYSQQMIALGEGEGSLEHITQALEQLSKVSCAIDRTTQAMYLLPWSGQSGEPASGERKAGVDISITRTTHPQHCLILDKVAVEEVQSDTGDTGPVEVLSGRKYNLSTLVFLPGETGTVTVPAFSEKPGYGYNYPLPGSLSRFVQVGSNFSNSRARIILEGNAWQLRCSNAPDVVIPEHEGQYVEITSGPNLGRRYRIRGYLPAEPNAPVPSGGTAVLDVLLILEAPIFGTLIPGERVVQVATGAEGIFLKATSIDGVLYRIAISVRVPGFQLGAGVPFWIDGQSSLASIIADPGFNPETAIVDDQTPAPDNDVSWQILDWHTDLGLTSSNAISPVGGRLGFLDELGRERAIARSPGESDSSYRFRVARLADTVSPNALKRAANKVLSPYGLSGTLLEVGQGAFPGFFYDAPEPAAFFYDMDCATLTGLMTGAFIEGEPVLLNVTPDLLPLGTSGLAEGYYAGFDPSTGKYFFSRKGLNGWVGATGNYVVGKISGAYLQVTGLVKAQGALVDKYKLWLDYTEFRAFFLMGLPKINLGEFGFAYDVGPYNFFESAPFLTFFDGFPTTTAILYHTIWNAMYLAKAGGAGFDLVNHPLGCP